MLEVNQFISDCQALAVVKDNLAAVLNFSKGLDQVGRIYQEVLNVGPVVKELIFPLVLG